MARSLRLAARRDGESRRAVSVFTAGGIQLANEAELLLQTGLDTADMNGDGFEPFVKAGGQVEVGNKLIAFDMDRIKAAGHPGVTVLAAKEEADRPLQM